MQPAHLQNRTITHATPEDQLAISKFLNQNILTHHHLDWFGPLDWLGQQPFLIEKIDHEIQALLLAAPEVRGSTWVRLFSVRHALTLADVWDRLLTHTISILQDASINQLAALGLSHWFSDLLTKTDFIYQKNIVVLDWKRDIPIRTLADPEILVRAMRSEDLIEVKHIDQLAFPPLWQNSLAGLTKAFHQPGISTVALKHDQIVGFQISTASTTHGHLARLAVHPGHQRQQIASSLVSDLLKQLVRLGIYRVTVNTQSDNKPSLALYEKIGFQRTQETIPVYLRTF